MGVPPKDAAWKVTAGFAEYLYAFVKKEVLPHVADACESFGGKARIDDNDASFVGIQTSPDDYWVTVNLAGRGEPKFELIVMADVEKQVMKETVDISMSGSAIGEKLAKAILAHQKKKDK